MSRSILFACDTCDVVQGVGEGCTSDKVIPVQLLLDGLSLEPAVRFWQLDLCAACQGRLVDGLVAHMDEFRALSPIRRAA